MIEEIRNNIEIEKQMASELSGFIDSLEFSMPQDKKLVGGMIDSLKKRIKLLNSSVDGMAREITLTKPLKEDSGRKAKKESGVEKVHFKKDKIEVALRKRDKDKFLKELSIGENLIKLLKKRKIIEREKVKLYKKTNAYGRLSNLLFSGLTGKVLHKKVFRKLNIDLRKSNLNILTATYVSMLFFTVFIALILGILITVFFLIFSMGLSFPVISLYQGSFLLRFIQVFWISLFVPFVTALAFYFYPATEKGSLAKRINQELPFVVIHMSSIAGSGIEPTKIFNIILSGKEYKYTRGEIRKLVNQINVYGYDLITALTNLAATTPSNSLSELMKGLAVTIKSGGDLKTFFEKRAETLLLGYRLEREKFVKMAETFMDIYISVVIAMPMILLLLLVMISVSGLGLSLGITEMSLAIIGLVGFVNIIFLTILNIKQPAY